MSTKRRINYEHSNVKLSSCSGALPAMISLQPFKLTCIWVEERCTGIRLHQSILPKLFRHTRVCVCNAYVYLKRFQLMERFSLGEQIQLPASCITVNASFSNEIKNFLNRKSKKCHLPNVTNNNTNCNSLLCIILIFSYE